MSSYNNTIIPRIVDYVSAIVRSLGSKDEQGRSAEVIGYDVIEPDATDISSLTQSGATEQYLIIFKFAIKDTEGELISEQKGELYVPKMINNMFIINGRPRVSTSTLDNDYEGAVYKDNIVFSNDVRCSYFKDVDGRYYFNFEVYTPEGDILDFQGNPENLETFKQYLKLSPYLKYKFQIKLDVDDIGDYITYDLLNQLVLVGPNILYDNIIDKRITTTEDNLLQTLYRRGNRQKIQGSTRSKFYKNGTIFLTDVQNAITKYFRVAKEKSIDIPMSINPLVYDSLRYKIVLPEHIAYNSSFPDLIDVVNTPENNNVNRLNELNICTTVKDGIMYITCYKYPSFEKVTLPYLEYLNKRVLSNEHVNYEDKVINESKEYNYKLRQKLRTTNSLKDMELIEPAPDEKLSITTRRIPLINMSDSVRVAMGASMSKQAIEVFNSEPALVSSGNDDEDYLSSSLITTFFGNSESVVDMIQGDMIFIKSKTDGTVVPIQIPSPTVGSNDSLISFETKFKVGDTVKPGDVVIYPKVLVNKSYDLGVNTKVFYMNYLGYTYEDGIVVSESYAERLTHYSMVDVSTVIRDQDNMTYIKKVGSRVQSKDILVGNQSKLRGRQSTVDAFQNNRSVLSTLGIEYNNNDLLVPNNVDEGYIVDVMITETTDSKFKTKSDVTKKTIDEYNPNDRLNEYESLPKKYKELKCRRGLLHPRGSYLVQFKIIRVNRLKVGDKQCNRWGSKGMISLIVPDHLMPRIDLDGHGNGPAAEMLLNPAAVVSRKNPSQLYETVLTKIIAEVWNRCQELVADGKVKEAKKFTEKYYGKRFTIMSDDDFVQSLGDGLKDFGMKVGSYSKISFDVISEWMKELGVEETAPIYVPDVIIETGHPEGRKVLDPTGYKPTPGIDYRFHELGFTEQPVITGESYMMKLYHSADYTGKVTSSIVDNSEPYMGRGVYRDKGQKLGEMEFWSLLSHGTEQFIRQGTSDMDSAQYQFLNEMLLAGYTMIDDRGYPILSPIRTKIGELFDKNKK